MKAKNVIWGLLLVFIGALFILKNFGVIYFNWHSVFRLWPFIIVFIGISILPVKDWIRIALAVAAIGLAVIMLVRDPGEPGDRWMHWWSDRDRTERWDDMKEVDQTITEPYDSSITRASFVFDAAAGSFSIENSSSDLFEFRRWGGLGKYHYAISGMDSTREIKIDFDGNDLGPSKVKNDVDIKLHPTPEWDLRIDVGAAEMNLDLTQFNVRSVDIEGGASSVKLRLGERCDNAEVSIESGASSIVIDVPESFACEVRTSTVLSSKDLKGFTRLGDGTYTTDNFSSANRNIMIRIDAAVSSLTVNRY